MADLGNRLCSTVRQPGMDDDVIAKQQLGDHGMVF
jgi:hypothetical protein